ncbi:restriction endonuclease subunit S [Jeotgalibaca porci]|uniref:restriction endonuclease subunit S n=1 Tax=Jeotgalibaca porci TaxID=1868793 RepID=UPI00359F9910
MMSKKSPQLRFEGFTDDWEQRKLNEVSDIYDGTHQTPKYQDDGVMFLSVENIKTLTSNKFISREAFEDEFKIRPQRGDVLMTRIGDIGTANVVETDEDLAYYVSLALFKSEELNPYFLQASIYAPFVQDQIWKRTLHIAFPKKINKNEIGQVPINVPTLAEQTKIGSFFKQLDNTITLHQRKLDLLKEQKKGYLQKMFPKNGAKVPELRFAGFADDWEERKLSDGTNKIGDGLHGTPKYSEDGEVYFVNGNNLVNGQIVIMPETKRVTSNEQSKDDKALNESTILMSINGTIGNLAWYRGENLMLGKSAAYIEVSDFDKKFIYAYLQTRPVKDYYLNSLTGTTIKNLGLKAIRNTNICTPTIDEQAKIGSFFKKLDDTIALHQRKLDLLKEQKKGFLQKMFV